MLQTTTHPMTQGAAAPRYQVVRGWAGHSNYGGSDKDWAGVLVQRVDSGTASSTLDSGEPQWMVMTVWGKSGGNLQGGEPPTTLMTRQQAEAVYQVRVREKQKGHYTAIPLGPFLPAFNVPLLPPERLTGPSEEEKRTEPSTPEPFAPPPPSVLSPACSVEAVEQWQAYTNARYGATEKANGERCLLRFDGEHLFAYNRNGEPGRMVPEGAKALTSLGKPFVMDGERLVGEQQGCYVAFDLLEWNGEDLSAWPYSKRIAYLAEILCGNRLIRLAQPTPTLREAAENSTRSDLLLLSPAKGPGAMTIVVNAVRSSAGEGIILRELGASYRARRAVLKYKFTTDLDAIIIGIKPGAAGGSLKLGLRRPSDNAIIECGHVRSGLSAEDMNFFLDQLITEKKLVVLKVEYLPARTSGIAVVEGRSSRDWVRTDKEAWACTTDQLGASKASLVKKARRVPGISFPQPLASTMRLPVTSEPDENTEEHPPQEGDLPSEEVTSQGASVPPNEEGTTRPAPGAIEVPPLQEERSSRPDAADTASAVMLTPRTSELTAVAQEEAETGVNDAVPSGCFIPLSVRDEQGYSTLDALLQQPGVILLDVRSRKLLQKLSHEQQCLIGQQALRAKWGLKYLYLGHALGDANEQKGVYYPIQLEKPTQADSTIQAFRAQGYTIVLLCSCPVGRHHLEQIVSRYGAQKRTPESFLAQGAASTEEQTILTPTR